MSESTTTEDNPIESNSAAKSLDATSSVSDLTNTEGSQVSEVSQ